MGHFPTGGWGWRWAGDPDRGFGNHQPGGWAYNILPYIEQETLHQMGAGQPDSQKRDLGRQAAETPIATYICPTRRRPIAYPYIHSMAYYNIDRPTKIGRLDYAACSGDHITNCMSEGPPTLAQGDDPNFSSLPCWPVATEKSNGIVYFRSQVKIVHVADGASHTYAVGEKYLDPDHYSSGELSHDDQGWNLGYDIDIIRWAINDPGNDNVLTPMSDRKGYYGRNRFGSAHTGGCNFVFCDGSVHTISYEIDAETHRRLGVRDDGMVVDSAAF